MTDADRARAVAGVSAQPQWPAGPAEPELAGPQPRPPGMRSRPAGAPRRPPPALLTRGTSVIVLALFAGTAATCLHPDISSLNGRERRRDMTAQAQRDRLAHQLSELARASRRAAGAGRRERRARRVVAALSQLRPRYRAVR